MHRYIGVNWAYSGASCVYLTALGDGTFKGQDYVTYRKGFHDRFFPDWETAKVALDAAIVLIAMSGKGVITGAS